MRTRFAIFADPLIVHERTKWLEDERGIDEMNDRNERGGSRNDAAQVEQPELSGIALLEHTRARIEAGGGSAAVDKQHKRGKLTARERLDRLYDPGTFLELGMFAKHRCEALAGKDIPGDGVVVGRGEVHGRNVLAFAQDLTVAGGSLGERHAQKIVELCQRALRCGAPVVGFNDSGGARIQEGVHSLSGYGRVFYFNTMLSGVVPQISVVAGPCAGGAAYSPALTDFVIMIDQTAHMFITGPTVIRAVTGEEITEEALGGANVHASVSGNVHLVAHSEDDAIAKVKQLLSYLPSNNLQPPPELRFDEPLVDDTVFDDLLPEDPRKPYDMHLLIERIVDYGEFFEIQPTFAPNILVGFARICGMVVGIVANQPAVMAGTLDINASDKASRFIRTCNIYNVPLLTLVDVPGFLPGVDQEHGGIIRHGAKMLFAYGSASVPKVTLIVRKAYGGAYLAMCSKDMGADIVLAWPSAEIAVMGPEAAVRVLNRDLLNDPEALDEAIAEYRRTHANPYRAAESLHVDDVIRPAWTRRLV
ncbi:MAG TPA: acyl-CoA carboxylase subunit beta, partial [Polyangiaceae bacterium]|nr:acyl-CoA carboxylase subunit beta [Polyangiaceae bacterium]